MPSIIKTILRQSQANISVGILSTKPYSRSKNSLDSGSVVKNPELPIVTVKELTPTSRAVRSDMIGV
ncbi:MAG: hypothetical protein AAFU67_00065 [Bacteroidota bacterium]